MFQGLLEYFIKMDNTTRTGILLGYFFTFELFIFFFMSPWLILLPFIFIVLLIYTSGKAEEIELANKQNNTV